MITEAKAENPFAWNPAPRGSGFFKPEFQQNSNADQIADYSYKAFVGIMSYDQLAIERYFKRLPGFDFNMIRIKIRNHVEQRLGLPLNSTTDAQILDLFKDKKRFFCKKVGREYWDTKASGYVLPAESELSWWDPRNSSVYADRTEWIIWYVLLDDGTEIDLFVGNCGNPVADAVVKSSKPTTGQFDDYDEEYAGNNGSRFRQGNPNSGTNGNGGNYNYNYNYNTNGGSNGNGQQGSTVNYNYYSQPQGGDRYDDNQNEGRQRIPFGQTWAGNATATAVGTAGGNLLYDALQGLFGGGRNYQNNNFRQNNFYRQNNYGSVRRYGGRHIGGGGGYYQPTRRYNTSMLNSQIPTNYGGRRRR